MFKSGRRIHLELIKLVIISFVVLLVITGLYFYSFLSTMLPLSLIAQSKVRISVFAVVTGALLLGITWMLVKWFTYSLLGPIPRLQRQMEDMSRTGDFRPLTSRKKDKLEDFIRTINLLIDAIQKKGK
jgi:hypothetical protein